MLTILGTKLPFRLRDVQVYDPPRGLLNTKLSRHWAYTKQGEVEC